MWMTLALRAGLLAALVGGPAAALGEPIALTDLTAVHRVSEITVGGQDVCYSHGPDHSLIVPDAVSFGLYVGPWPYAQVASRFRGTTGSAGDVWLATYPEAPVPVDPAAYTLVVSASGSACYPLGDHGPGLVVLYQGTTNSKFLLLWAEEGGNTDAYRLMLCTAKPNGTPIPCSTLKVTALDRKSVV